MEENKNASIDYFKKYMLSQKSIAFSGSKLNKDGCKLLCDEKIRRHMEAIKEFHDVAERYNEPSGLKLKSSAGRLIEKYKMDLKKAKREFLRFQAQKDLNEFETYFLENAGEMIKKGERSIYEADNEAYLMLILRSMKKNEICLGDVYFDNLKKLDTGDVLEIASVDKCSHDMVEMDGIYFLKKLRNKITSDNLKKMTAYYCNIEGLGSESIHFIFALLSYPYDFMKTSIRYMENRKDWSTEDYLKKLKKSVAGEKESFI